MNRLTCCVAENEEADVDSVERELEQHGVEPEQGADDQVEDVQRRGQQICEAQTLTLDMDWGAGLVTVTSAENGFGLSNCHDK